MPDLNIINLVKILRWPLLWKPNIITISSLTVKNLVGATRYRGFPQPLLPHPFPVHLPTDFTHLNSSLPSTLHFPYLIYIFPFLPSVILVEYFSHGLWINSRIFFLVPENTVFYTFISLINNAIIVLLAIYDIISKIF